MLAPWSYYAILVAPRNLQNESATVLIELDCQKVNPA
jgi:hypothetical protein